LNTKELGCSVKTVLWKGHGKRRKRGMGRAFGEWAKSGKKENIGRTKQGVKNSKPLTAEKK